MSALETQALLVTGATIQLNIRRQVTNLNELRTILEKIDKYKTPLKYWEFYNQYATEAQEFSAAVDAYKLVVSLIGEQEQEMGFFK